MLLGGDAGIAEADMVSTHAALAPPRSLALRITTIAARLKTIRNPPDVVMCVFTFRIERT